MQFGSTVKRSEAKAIYGVKEAKLKRYLSLTTARYCAYENRLWVDARSKALVCGRPLAGIEGSNPAWDMNVCLL
jgi:uncharacterized UBP type Zn finger protein